MKRIWLMSFVMTMLFASSAMAEEIYPVKGGDTLGRIAEKYGTTPEEIKRANPSLVKDVDKIVIGWQLTIPTKGKLAAVESSTRTLVPTKFKIKAKTVKTRVATKNIAPVDIYTPGKVGIRQGVYSRPGSAPTTMSDNKAFNKVLLKEEIKAKLKAAINNNAGVDDFIKSGDQFLMTYGSDGVMDATFKYNGDLAAVRYMIESNGVVYDIRYIPWCRNWTRYPEIKVPSIAMEAPSRVLPSRPEIPTISTTPPETEIVATPPMVREEDPFEYLAPPKKHLTIEHEPILGLFYSENKLGDNQGGFGEYTGWVRKGHEYIFENGWSPGAGAYGLYSEFDSKISTFEGEEYSYGPQIGIKYIGHGANPINFQIKGRFVWEYMSGSNNEGYAFEQEGTKAGLYSEVTKKVNEKLTVGIIGEVWWDIDSSRTSTFSGDVPSERGMASLDVFGQYQFNKDWGARASAGIFTQEWDDLTGIHARLEARWKNTIMFGPHAAWFPFGLSDVYEGFSSSDLTSYGAFVRVEFGEPIRQHYAKKRMAGIKTADREWLDDLLETKFSE